MRFLVDEAMQDAVAERLAAAGHDAVHVRQLGLSGSPDDALMDLARDEGRGLLTLDTDFGTLLALSGAAAPSVILLRGLADDAETRVAALLVALPSMDIHEQSGRTYGEPRITPDLVNTGIQADRKTVAARMGEMRTRGVCKGQRRMPP